MHVLVARTLDVVLFLQLQSLAQAVTRMPLVQKPDALHQLLHAVVNRHLSALFMRVLAAQQRVQDRRTDRCDEGDQPSPPDQALWHLVLWSRVARFCRRLGDDAVRRIPHLLVEDVVAEQDGVQHIQPHTVHEVGVMARRREHRRVSHEPTHGDDGKPLEHREEGVHVEGGQRHHRVRRAQAVAVAHAALLLLVTVAEPRPSAAERVVELHGANDLLRREVPASQGVEVVQAPANGHVLHLATGRRVLRQDVLPVVLDLHLGLPLEGREVVVQPIIRGQVEDPLYGREEHVHRSEGRVLHVHELALPRRNRQDAHRQAGAEDEPIPLFQVGFVEDRPMRLQGDASFLVVVGPRRHGQAEKELDCDAKDDRPVVGGELFHYQAGLGSPADGAVWQEESLMWRHFGVVSIVIVMYLQRGVRRYAPVVLPI
mmetsp:Transcript_67921/g.189690  ORF Transcript_67921/g.189690 Transcript_67921/m.189690 type:complete len:428 (-) Transcript_67921:62-1345(-)